MKLSLAEIDIEPFGQRLAHTAEQPAARRVSREIIRDAHGGSRKATTELAIGEWNGAWPCVGS
jgi:hypothetical protein